MNRQIVIACFVFASALSINSHGQAYHATIEEAIAASGLPKGSIDLENELIKTAEIIQKSNPEDFAGNWLEYDASNNPIQVIAVTRHLKSLKSIELNSNYKIVYVKNSQKNLQSTEQKISQILFGS